MANLQFMPLVFTIRYCLKSKIKTFESNGKQYPRISSRKTLRDPNTEKAKYFKTFEDAVEEVNKQTTLHEAYPSEDEFYRPTIASLTFLSKGTQHD